MPDLRGRTRHDLQVLGLVVAGREDDDIAATPGTTTDVVAGTMQLLAAPWCRGLTHAAVRPPRGVGPRPDTVSVVDPAWLDEQQQRTWRAWLAVTELLPRTLDAQLQRDAGLTHAAYVVLAMLSEAPDRSRRMSDLARTANQSQSRLSHTVARLEERGWVRRERATEDRRGNLAVLTDAGWDVVSRVAPGHVVAVREGLFAALTAEQTEALGDALTAVLERLDPDHTLRVPEAG